MDARFVFRALEYSIQDVIAKAHGDIPGLTRNHILDHQVMIPGRKTQGAVASKIDELFSSIDEAERALERVRKLVERYRQSVLKAAVTGELTREWREQHAGELESGEALLTRILEARRQAWEQSELAKMDAKGVRPYSGEWKKKYKEAVSPNSSKLPELPNRWTWASLPQLGEFGRGKSKHRPRNSPLLFGGQDPFIQTGIVRSSKGSISSFSETYNEFGLAQSKLWLKVLLLTKSGALLLTLSGVSAISSLSDDEVHTCGFDDSWGELNDLVDSS